MANITFKLDRKVMAQFANSSGVGDAALDAARRGKTHAESIAPVGATGEYARSFEVEKVEVDVQVRGGSEKRAGAILRNTAPHSLPVEGSHSVLRRTVDVIENGG